MPGEGKIYRHPTNPVERLRLMHGYPEHPTPVKRGPYVVVTKDDGSPSRLIPLKGNPTLDPGYKEPPGRDSATPLRRLLLDYIEDDYYSLSEVAFIVARAVGQEDPPLDLTISQELVRGLIGDGLARLCLGLTFQGDEQEIVPTDIDSWLKGEHWEKPVPGAGHVRLIITPAGEREHLLN